MDKILLSYVIPVYNVEEYLQRCFESIYDESKKSLYEIILVDDGSKDRCPQICDKLASQKLNVKVIHKENGGLSDARNTGLSVAQGKYIFFVDSDDYLRPSSTKRLVSCLSNCNTDIACMGSIHVKKDEQKKFLFSPTDTILSGEEFLALQYKKKTMQVAVWNSIYRREFLTNNDIWFKKGLLHEDLEWTPRVFVKAKSVCIISEPLYMYLIRDGSISQSKDMRKNMKDIMSTVKSLSVYLKDKTNVETFRLIKDSLICSYLSMYSHGKFYKYGSEYCLEHTFVRADLYWGKTKAKALLYSISKKIYCLIGVSLGKED